MIWITAFNWQPDAGKAQHLAWLKQAYLLLRAQLYLGAAFYRWDSAIQAGLDPVQVAGEIGEIIAVENQQASIQLDPEPLRQHLIKSHEKGRL